MPIDLQVGAQLDEVVELAHVAAHRHEHQEHVWKPPSPAFRRDQPSHVLRILSKVSLRSRE